jgi:TolA-binding protein
VSKDELRLLKKKVKTKSSASKTQAKRYQKSKKSLLADAIKAYRAGKYDHAKELFTLLSEKNYKRATSNYYLGEIAYYQKRYNDAIVYYKKSASLYDKASYMPTLLLHTAISFKKLGEKENARRFFEALTATYPGSSQAKVAKKYL